MDDIDFETGCQMMFKTLQRIKGLDRDQQRQVLASALVCVIEDGGYSAEEAVRLALDTGVMMARLLQDIHRGR